jgi:hypothetical protein
MRRAWVVLVVGGMCTPLTARAGNSDEVNAGIDVTLSGGAVVASVYTGAALWYNPAGIARIDKTSLELTGATLQVQMIDAPGLLSLSTGEQSEGKTTNLSVIPEAITFTSLLRTNLKLGVGLFNSSIRRVLVTEEVTSTEGASPIVEAVGGQSSRVDFFHISTGLAAEFGRAQKFLFGGSSRGTCASVSPMSARGGGSRRISSFTGGFGHPISVSTSTAPSTVASGPLFA